MIVFLYEVPLSTRQSAACWDKLRKHAGNHGGEGTGHDHVSIRLRSLQAN